MDSVDTLNAIGIVDSDLNSVVLQCNQSVTSGSGDKTSTASQDPVLPLRLLSAASSLQNTEIL